MKKNIYRIWPILVITVLWFIFSSPYFIRRLIPFPSTYLVTFFQPWNATYGMPVKNNAMPDIISQIYPWKKLTIDSWKQGEIPLWNPYSLSGTVHAGNYQTAVFSPLNILFFVLPFIDAWSIMVLLQPLITALGMYVLLRSFHRSRIASSLGAIGFMFCSFITTWMAYGTLGYAIAGLPWALWAVSNDFIKRSYYMRVILSASISFSLVSGHFQTSIYMITAVLSFIIYKTWVSRNIREGSILAFYVLCGILLAAPQLLLTSDAYRASTRSASFIKGEVIPWQYIATLFSPDFYGNPVTRNDWFGHYAEWGSYIGIIPLLLAIIGISSGLRGYKKFFFTIAAGAFLLAYPTPATDLLFLMKLPVLSTSAASRIIVLASFALSALASFGMNDLIGYWKTKKIRQVILPTCIFAVIVIFLWGIVYFIRPFSYEHLAVAKRNLIFPTLVGIVGILCIAIGYIKIRFFRTKLSSAVLMTAAGTVLLIAQCIDSYRFAAKWMPFDQRIYAYPEEQSVTFLQKNTGEIDRAFGNIGGEVSATFAIPVIEGYDAMYQQRYGEFINAISTGNPAAEARSVVQFDKYGLYKTQAFKLLGVRYIYHRVSDKHNVWAFPYWEYTADSSMRQVFNDEKYQIYLFTHAFPRVFLASSYRIASDKQGIIDTMFSPDINLRETLVLEKKPLLEPTTGIGEASITVYKPNRIELNTRAETPKLLFLSDVYDQGWRVAVDGKLSDIYRADYDFRAVALPAGSHKVVFTYFPDSMLRGIIIAVCSLVLLFVGGICMKYYENRHI